MNATTGRRMEGRMTNETFIMIVAYLNGIFGLACILSNRQETQLRGIGSLLFAIMLLLGQIVGGPHAQ